MSIWARLVYVAGLVGWPEDQRERVGEQVGGNDAWLGELFDREPIYEGGDAQRELIWG